VCDSIEEERLRWDRNDVVRVHDVFSISAPFSRGTQSGATRGALLPRQGLHFREGDPSSPWGRSPEKAEARRPKGAAIALKRCPREGVGNGDIEPGNRRDR